MTTVAHHSVCFDMLLNFVNNLSSRQKETPWNDQDPDAVVIRKNRMQKKLLIEGSLLFNESPKKGMAFLQGGCLILKGSNEKSLIEDHRASISTNSLGFSQSGYFSCPESVLEQKATWTVLVER